MSRTHDTLRYAEAMIKSLGLSHPHPVLCGASGPGVPLMHLSSPAPLNHLSSCLPPFHLNVSPSWVVCTHSPVSYSSQYLVCFKENLKSFLILPRKHDQFLVKKDQYWKLVPNACNSSTWEAETGGSQVQGQPQQLSKVLSNVVRSCFKIKIIK